MLKNKKGITLIALLITVVIMLVLAALTVATALKGNLFNETRNAKSSTEIEKDKEILVAATTGAINDYGVFDHNLLDNKLPAGFSGSNGTYVKDGVTFKVNKYGSVTVEESVTYEIGDEVTIAGEKFNVIGQTSTTVTLFVSNNNNLGSSDLSSVKASSGDFSKNSCRASVVFGSYLNYVKGEIENEWGHSILEVRCITLDEINSLLNNSHNYVLGVYDSVSNYPSFFEGQPFWIDNDNTYGSSIYTVYWVDFAEGFTCLGNEQSNSDGEHNLRPVIVVNKADL